MSPKESKLPHDWYEKAKKEIKRVKILLEAEDIEDAGFHLQQAAEKAIKGFL
ncbi:MAG: HEPN domain-containing protein [bacterium]